jgi:hypothetical protein
MNLGRGRLLTAVVVATAGLTLSACGSSPSASSTRSTCTDVAAVLSDGPDQGADPVGYAEAQIEPLRQVHTSNTALKSAIDALSSAYRQYYTTNGASSAKRALARASRVIDVICPGVVS